MILILILKSIYDLFGIDDYVVRFSRKIIDIIVTEARSCVVK